MTAAQDREPGATVVPYEDGPLLIRGDFVLMTPDGEVFDPGRATVALCRCGKSAMKPFCDGTHKAVGFRAGTAPDGGAGTADTGSAEPGSGPAPPGRH